MDQKLLGDELLNNNKFTEAIEQYTVALDNNNDENKYKLYLNRCLANYKLEKYDDALSDAVLATKLNSDNAKAWGRVGSCLLVLNRNKEAQIAFQTAFDLDKTNESYRMLSKNVDDEDTEDEMDNLEKTFNNINLNSILNNSPENMISNIFSNIISNESLITKLSEPEFQKTLVSYEKNPLNALKDKELMILMNDLLKTFTQTSK
jgi:tetratricopeptide (TPR) repeat protein